LGGIRRDQSRASAVLGVQYRNALRRVHGCGGLL
jgi:hypothetical protein